MRHARWIALAGLAAALAVPQTACKPKGPVEPAPEARRPKAKKEKDDAPRKVVKTDCDPIEDPLELPAPLKYDERSVEEARNLANDGVAKLLAAEKRGTGKIEEEQLITDAVELLITSLKADPYNVHATYNLAAAYARIDRNQCAVNLLSRLVQLRKLASQKAEVEEKLDRLLGRGKWRGNLDPDFNDLRDERNFRELVKKF